MKTKTNQQLAMEVSIVTIIGNVILSAFKLIAGITGHSTAMVSDADSIERRKELVIYCMVHVNPVEAAVPQEIVPLTNPE